MNASNTFKSLFESARNTLEYKVEGLIIDFTEQLHARLVGLGMSKTDLAGRLQTSPAYVSKLFSGGTNFTLESMVKVTEALESEIRVEVVPKVTINDWIQVVEESGQSEKSKILSLWNRRHSSTFNADEEKSLIGLGINDNEELSRVA